MYTLAAMSKAIMTEKRTTQPPRIDVEAFFPQLSDFRKSAVRLFPRPKPIMSVDESKLGGNIIWPEGESWPYCTVHNVPFVALIQLTKKDVPELGFKWGKDVFQILWCLHSHDECDFLPDHRVYWRDSARVEQSLSAIPDVVVNEIFTPADSGEFVPVQCCFYPERMIEYPGYEELSQNLQEELTQWYIADIPGINELEEDWENVPFGPGGWLYSIELSVSGGTKIGGYPEWIQYPEYPACSCGKTMEHLISISSLETVLGNPAQRWIPIEEKHLSEDERYGLHYGTRLMFGDGGIVYVFICRSCEDWPIKFVWQCG
jgi:hypothetical protein